MQYRVVCALWRADAYVCIMGLVLNVVPWCNVRTLQGRCADHTSRAARGEGGGGVVLDSGTGEAYANSPTLHAEEKSRWRLEIGLPDIHAFEAEPHSLDVQSEITVES
jgi:hypothetical protein